MVHLLRNVVAVANRDVGINSHGYLGDQTVSQPAYPLSRNAPDAIGAGRHVLDLVEHLGLGPIE